MPSTMTPLRYPGGKSKLKKYMRQIIAVNGLEGGTYVEPYAGGAGIAVDLILSGTVSKAILNDIDPSIFAFWHSVLYDTDALCEQIRYTPVTVNEWLKQREVQKNKNEVTLLELGFSTFFLNRTNRSGIIEGGIIGGLRQSGSYKLDCRFNKDTLIDKIRDISWHRDRFEIHCKDAEELLTSSHSWLLSPRTFLFIDPPYVGKGSKLYGSFYRKENHERIAALIRELTVPWLVTYDNVPLVENMYADYKQMKYSVNYTAQRKYAGSEIMIFSNGLAIPVPGRMLKVI